VATHFHHGWEAAHSLVHEAWAGLLAISVERAEDADLLSTSPAVAGVTGEPFAKQGGPPVSRRPGRCGARRCGPSVEELTGGVREGV